MNRAVAERDAVTEAVLASGTPKLSVQPDVLAFGVWVKAGRLQTDVDWGSRCPPLHTCPIVWQGVVLPGSHRAGLMSCICGRRSIRGKARKKKRPLMIQLSWRGMWYVNCRTLLLCDSGKIKTATFVTPAVGKTA